MVVVSSTSRSIKSNFAPQLSTAANHHCSNTSDRPISPSLLYLGQIYGDPTRHKNSKAPSSSGFFSVKPYMDNPNSISSFASKVIGSLPVFGLIARILSDEGGPGRDTVDFAEFRRRVGKTGEEDERLLNVMLRVVYPSVERSELQRIINEKAQKVAEGSICAYPLHKS